MRSLLALPLLLLVGCSGEWKSKELGIEMELPRGSTASTANENGLVDLGGGLQIARVKEQLPVFGSVPHDQIAATALAKIPNASAHTITTRTEGDIAGTKVLRFDLKDGASRGLMYVVPRGAEFLVLYAAASDSKANDALNRAERSFGTLKFKD